MTAIYWSPSVDVPTPSSICWYIQSVFQTASEYTSVAICPDFTQPWCMYGLCPFNFMRSVDWLDRGVVIQLSIKRGVYMYTTLPVTFWLWKMTFWGKVTFFWQERSSLSSAFLALVSGWNHSGTGKLNMSVILVVITSRAKRDRRASLIATVYTTYYRANRAVRTLNQGER